MTKRFFAVVSLATIALAVPVGATTAIEFYNQPGQTRVNFPPYLQCVPYARQVSGISIFGDALTWWGQAEHRYAKGHVPRVGAVMAFKPYGNMRLGHVAAVSRIIDSRTVLIRHSNWSPINGRRGQIEDNVRAIDVSPNNDWSAVRVWFDPIKAIGGKTWPVHGFIYNARPGSIATGQTRLAAISNLGPRGGVVPVRATLPSALDAEQPSMTRATTTRKSTSRKSTGGRSDSHDPIGDIIAEHVR